MSIPDNLKEWYKQHYFRRASAHSAYDDLNQEREGQLDDTADQLRKQKQFERDLIESRNVLPTYLHQSNQQAYQ